VGKPFGKKPTSPIGYDCLRASTSFYVNSQRISISKALAKTRGGGLLLIERLLLLLPLKALRVSSSSLKFLRPGIAYYTKSSTIDSRG
jgi:hypothetical protein